MNSLTLVEVGKDSRHLCTLGLNRQLIISRFLIRVEQSRGPSSEMPQSFSAPIVLYFPALGQKFFSALYLHRVSSLRICFGRSQVESMRKRGLDMINSPVQASSRHRFLPPLLRFLLCLLFFSAPFSSLLPFHFFLLPNFPPSTSHPPYSFPLPTSRISRRLPTTICLHTIFLARHTIFARKKIPPWIPSDQSDAKAFAGILAASLCKTWSSKVAVAAMT